MSILKSKIERLDGIYNQKAYTKKQKTIEDVDIYEAQISKVKNLLDRYVNDMTAIIAPVHEGVMML